MSEKECASVKKIVEGNLNEESQGGKKGVHEKNCISKTGWENSKLENE